jgi:hypothetical protein
VDSALKSLIFWGYMDMRDALDAGDYRRAERVFRSRRGDVAIIVQDHPEVVPPVMCESCGTWHRELRECPFCFEPMPERI